MTVSIPVAVLVKPLLFLFSSFALLDAVELEDAEEGNTEGDRDRFPSYGRLAPGFA